MSTIHFIHTSDWHLGFNQYYKRERSRDFRNAVQSIVNKILELKPQFVLHTGDLFHHNRPTPDTVIDCVKLLQRIQKKGIPFYIVRGNHDAKVSKQLDRRGGMINLLHQFGLVTMIDDEIVEEEDYAILGAGYYSGEGTTKVIDQLLNTNPEFLESEKFKIIAFHAFVEGQMENNTQIPLSKVSGLGVDYIGAGHYHIPWVNEDLRIYAPGSSEATSTTDWRRDDMELKVSMYSSFYEVKADKVNGRWQPPRVTTHKVKVRPKILIEYTSNVENIEVLRSDVLKILEKKREYIRQKEPELAETRPLVSISLDTNIRPELIPQLQLQNYISDVLHLDLSINGLQSDIKLEISEDTTVEDIFRELVGLEGEEQDQVVDLIMKLVLDLGEKNVTTEIVKSKFEEVAATLAPFADIYGGEN